MAIPITHAELLKFYTPSKNDDPNSTALWIALTDSFVNQHLVGVEDPSGSVLTTAELEHLELLLVPYFMSTGKQPVASSSAGGSSSSFQGLYAFFGMAGNIWGQRAMEYDRTGVLLELSRKATAASRGRDSSVPSTIDFISEADQGLLT